MAQGIQTLVLGNVAQNEFWIKTLAHRPCTR